MANQHRGSRAGATELTPEERRTKEAKKQAMNAEIEMIQNLSKDRPCGTCPCPRECYTRETVKSLYAWSCTIFVITVGVLTALSIWVIHPHLEWVMSGFEPTTCVTIGSNLTSEWQTCACGRSCTSSYVCAEVVVQYTHRDGRNITTRLYDSEYDLSRGKCSYQPTCLRSSDDNNKDVNDYVTQWGSASTTFTCLHNPSRDAEVVRAVRGDTALVLHLLLWPLLVLILSGMGFTLPYLICGCRHICDKKPAGSLAVPQAEAGQKSRTAMLTQHFRSVSSSESGKRPNSRRHSASSRVLPNAPECHRMSLTPTREQYSHGVDEYLL